MPFQVMKPLLLAVLLCVTGFSNAQVQDSCNPLELNCPPVPGINSTYYFIDFTKSSTLPSEWILADYENVTFGPNGVEFTYNKLKDAPYIWTKDMFMFGHVEVVMQAAPGVGIISSAVLISDDADEIDWEFSGNNFGYSSGKVQTNYFGKGITGSYDRGTLPNIADPQTSFHTYNMDWTPSSLTWSIDDAVLRTLLASDANTSDHQYPQTPSRLQLGLWNGGDPSNAAGTIQWATGGVPQDLSQAPFSMYVKSVKILPMMACASYQYTDKSGSSSSIDCVGGTDPNSSSSSSSLASANSTIISATLQQSGNGMSESQLNLSADTPISALKSTFDPLTSATTITLTLISASSNPSTSLTTIPFTTCVTPNSTVAPAASTPTVSSMAFSNSGTDSSTLLNRSIIELTTATSLVLLPSPLMTLSANIDNLVSLLPFPPLSDSLTSATTPPAPSSAATLVPTTTGSAQTVPSSTIAGVTKPFFNSGARLQVSVGLSLVAITATWLLGN